MPLEIPADKINLKLICQIMAKVSKRKISFSRIPTDSASDVAQYVFNHWPEDWADQKIVKPEILRLIFQGRFLHGNVTLGGLQLPLGKTTVMHLVPRENLPKVNSQGLNIEYFPILFFVSI
ncbi:Ubiquitin-like protein 3 [Sarcoptes scabiei]|uniref:Ubiquitin-like protein 3 n=1 Tax=Sarcoptes scabiei TaxID=52283 RepID=A0A834RD96_SARSC|nr:Ubiquitin-like protein 3 [Sarcoptes scabiei]